MFASWFKETRLESNLSTLRWMCHYSSWNTRKSTSPTLNKYTTKATTMAFIKVRAKSSIRTKDTQSLWSVRCLVWIISRRIHPRAPTDSTSYCQQMHWCRRTNGWTTKRRDLPDIWAPSQRRHAQDGIWKERRVLSTSSSLWCLHNCLGTQDIFTWTCRTTSPLLSIRPLDLLHCPKFAAALDLLTTQDIWTVSIKAWHFGSCCMSFGKVSSRTQSNGFDVYISLSP